MTPRVGGLPQAPTMAVEEIDEKYGCNICGYEVKVTRVGGGTLVCCGENSIAAQTEDTMSHWPLSKVVLRRVVTVRYLC